MSYQSIWYYTDIPQEIVESIERDLTINFSSSMAASELHGGISDISKRNSTNAWIPTSHWTAGFIWHYVQRANRENFLYDLHCIDGESMQFTSYQEGQYYHWHTDAGFSTQYKPVAVGNCAHGLVQDHLNQSAEMVRKLSFVLQLSNHDDYLGGNLQLLDETGKSFIAPRRRGTIILFDSRTQHRVHKVRSGTRKSLVGWVVGKRWS